ncbi:MAG: NADH-quinone oxidoreductase subunit L [Planctomycetota bacterium]
MEILAFNPAVDFKLLLAVPLIPLVGFAVQIFFGRKLPRKGDWMLTGGMFIVMAITVLMAAKAIAAGYAGKEFAHHSSEAGLTWGWLYQRGESAATPLNVNVGMYFDGLGAAMLVVVGIVSFCVHLFSAGYMQGDRRYHIFFANISLFTFAMLGLVLSDNLLILFLFWELMGLMSYLLIGHFSHDPNSPRITQAASASKKAFLTTRVGDTCLFVGLMIFFYHHQTLSMTELWRLCSADVAANGGQYPLWMTIAGLLIFGGTVGKSAQFPLHIWLPDAMEGPTPVSAMIHAATMVAAGVFLLGRTYPLMSPEVLTVVTVVGSFTALFAATIGTTVFDIKGVLAYSTISQLGFMVAAVGLGGVVAGMFHMVTHAFFKACLFLCAGSVIHGCHHEQDMRKMGGLRKFMPITFACMLVSTLAIAGIPLFSGFYSKDKIIMAAFQRTLENFSGAHVFAAIALPCAALLTAFYMFRLIFMTFFGEYRGAHGGASAAHAHAGGHDDHAHAHHAHDEHAAHGHASAHDAHADHGHDDHGHAHTPHESPWPMTVALSILALLGVLGGHFWLATPGDVLANHTDPWFIKIASVERMYGGVVAEPVMTEHAEQIEHEAHTLALTVSLCVALGGILLAFLMYFAKKIDPAKIARGLGEIYHAVANKYYIDELVNATVIRGTMVLALAQKWFDEKIIDGIVNGVGWINKGIAAFSSWFDKAAVDGTVNGVGLVTQTFGSVVRLLQSGRVQQYVSFAVAGSLAAAAWLILS